VAAQLHLDRGREPPQAERVTQAVKERRLRQVVLGGDVLHEPWKRALGGAQAVARTLYLTCVGERPGTMPRPPGRRERRSGCGCARGFLVNRACKLSLRRRGGCGLPRRRRAGRHVEPPPACASIEAGPSGAK
jgi:hypothetical protein